MAWEIGATVWCTCGLPLGEEGDLILIVKDTGAEVGERLWTSVMIDR